MLQHLLGTAQMAAHKRRPTREKVHALKNNEVPIQLTCAIFSSGSPGDLWTGWTREGGFNLLTDGSFDIFMGGSYAKIVHGLHKKHILKGVREVFANI